MRINVETFTLWTIAAGMLLFTPAAAQAQIYTNPTGTNATVVSPNSFSHASSGDGNGYDNKGNLEVLGGLFEDDKSDGLYVESGATATIMGGECENNKVGFENQGTTTVANGTFNSNTEIGLYNVGVVAIGDGTFSNNGDGFHNSGSGTVLGGSFEGNLVGIYNSGGSYLTIAGADDVGNQYGILNFANLTITGGDFTSNTGAALDNYGTVTITGGTFIDYTGNTFAIANQSTAATITIYVSKSSVGFVTLPSGGATGSFKVQFAAGGPQVISYKNNGVIKIVPYTTYP